MGSVVIMSALYPVGEWNVKACCTVVDVSGIKATVQTNSSGLPARKKVPGTFSQTH